MESSEHGTQPPTQARESDAAVPVEAHLLPLRGRAAPTVSRK